MWRGRQRQDIKTKQIHGAAKRGVGAAPRKKREASERARAATGSCPSVRNHHQFGIASSAPPAYQPTRTESFDLRSESSASSSPPRPRHAAVFIAPLLRLL